MTMYCFTTTTVDQTYIGVYCPKYLFSLFTTPNIYKNRTAELIYYEC